MKFNKLLLCFLAVAGTSSYADSMTENQGVLFEGFTGAKFSYIPPTTDQINSMCDSKYINSQSSHFPEVIPPRDPVSGSDQYSMKFSYSKPSSQTQFSCAIPLTTAVTWVSGGTQYKCILTVVVGGGMRVIAEVAPGTYDPVYKYYTDQQSSYTIADGSSCSVDDSKPIWVVHKIQ